MAQIIISYRRADSDAIAGRIRDRLANHFGENSVFMDIDSIPIGIDFRKHIQDTLARSDILIAVIGPKWLGHGKSGHMRISDETDPVRIEIETALRYGSPVIPVLIGGARMPRPVDLPDSLTDLSYRNATEVDAGRDFNQHIDRLIRSVERLVKPTLQVSNIAEESPAHNALQPTTPHPPTLVQAPEPATSTAMQTLSSGTRARLVTEAAQPTPQPGLGKRRYPARLMIALSACLIIASGVGIFIFLASPSMNPNMTAATRPTFDARAMELSHWESVRNSSSVGTIQTYLDLYPDGPFASLAKARIKELEQPQRSTQAAILPAKSETSMTPSSLIPRTTQQPSVDCAKPNEPIEFLICADAELAEWDGRMAQIYKLKLNDGRNQETLRRQQRMWIESRDTGCDVPKRGNWSIAQLAPKKACLLQMMKARTNALAAP
jgi:uncharacterized protein YecT (DUF1311 family)